jgi:hypothetical protein
MAIRMQQLQVGQLVRTAVTPPDLVMEMPLGRKRPVEAAIAE